jgi:hypothetical protein
MHGRSGCKDEVVELRGCGINRGPKNADVVSAHTREPDCTRGKTYFKSFRKDGTVALWCCKTTAVSEWRVPVILYNNRYRNSALRFRDSDADLHSTDIQYHYSALSLC